MPIWVDYPSASWRGGRRPGRTWALSLDRTRQEALLGTGLGDHVDGAVRGNTVAVNDIHLGDMLETGVDRRFRKGTDLWSCHCILGLGGTEMVVAVGGLYLDHGGDCRTWAPHRIHSSTTCC